MKIKISRLILDFSKKLWIFLRELKNYKSNFILVIEIPSFSRKFRIQKPYRIQVFFKISAKMQYKNKFTFNLNINKALKKCYWLVERSKRIKGLNQYTQSLYILY